MRNSRCKICDCLVSGVFLLKMRSDVHRMTIIRYVVRKIYHEMQRHYISFRFLVWLKEKGITRRVNFLISHGDDTFYQKNPTEEMLKSKRFFQQNEDRVKKLYGILADDKSRETLGGVIKYRAVRQPLANELYSEWDQYFVKDIIQMADNEVFIDGGAYTGDTIQQFMDTAKKGQKRIGRVIAFEPDPENYQLLNKFYGKNKKVMVINKGLANRSGELWFQEKGVASQLTEDEMKATTKVPVVNIDSVPECQEATWIKMDIEGAEMDALHGAEKTIKRNHPKLTICIYHSDGDLLRIAEYVHELVPEYKLYIRHHSKSDVETVLYAVCL